MKIFTILIAILILEFPLTSNGFALLSHEAIIDATWDKTIKPLLKRKYPSSTEDQLNEARSYSYGGSLVPDIGYAPFGSIQFTNLLHYVRSGDFVQAALDEAQNINEYAFGLGLLCHYNADKYGHSLGTNIALPLLFPKAKEKYGDTISYELAPSQHTRTEFGFDVLQTAKGNYASDEQHDLIGFRISEPVLERAFLKTYGMEMKEVFESLPLAIETFRFAVRHMFPELTKDAWKVRKSLITKLNPLAEQAAYTQKTDRKNYNKEFGKPQLKSSLMSLIIGILPKIGPLAGLKFKEPTEEAERIFDKSFAAIIVHYTASLKKLETEKIQMENINYDTGKKTSPGDYEMADKTYYKLLKKQKSKKFENMNNGLKKNLLAFYTDPKFAAAYKNKPCRLKKVSETIEELKMQ
ncbi:MAG: zinc dependent phospholipase C family protein [Bacteroidia bacterium]